MTANLKAYVNIITLSFCQPWQVLRLTFLLIFGTTARVKSKWLSHKLIFSVEIIFDTWIKCWIVLSLRSYRGFSTCFNLILIVLTSLSVTDIFYEILILHHLPIVPEFAMIEIGIIVQGDGMQILVPSLSVWRRKERILNVEWVFYIFGHCEGDCGCENLNFKNF